MKRIRMLLAVLLSAALLSGCASQGSGESASASVSQDTEAEQAVSFTDVMGYPVTLNSWDRVVSLYGSFGETWMLAGGTLVGTTSDAIEERGLVLGDEVAIVGSVKQPNFEEILAANPDFVILSADTAEHVELHDALTDAGIAHAYYRVDTFSDYLSMLEQFCSLTGRDDLYEQNGLEVQAQIQQVLEQVEGREGPTVLLLRAYSTGAKAKGADNLAGVMLEDLGAENLVERYDSLLEEVSMEEVIAADPDYIFVVTMGSSQEKALEYMSEHFQSNPAWAGLTAVANDHYVVLPKELFHYKPNARWGESYAYLAEILYPDLAGTL